MVSWPLFRRSWQSCVLHLVASLVLTGAFVSVAATGANADSGIRYITPAGAGSRDGSGWADAATLDQLPGMVRAVGPGGRILLLAGEGAYRVPREISIRSGGKPGRPVVVRGAARDGSPAEATIRGSRTVPYAPSGNPGREVFRLLAGADDLSFSHLRFVNVGNGAFRVGADLSRLSIQHTSAQNVRRFLENTSSGEAPSATISGLTIRDVTVHGFSRGAVRLRYDTHDVLMEDVVGDSQRQDGDNFAIGVHLEGTVHDVVLRNVSMSNAQDTLHPYWNGDGFASENGTYRVRLEDTTAVGSTDAGYDMKSDDLTLVRTVASGNKRNYRLWGRGVVVTAASATDPVLRGGSGSQAQFWIGRQADVVIEGSTARDTSSATVVYAVESNGRLAVRGNAVQLHMRAVLSRVDHGAVFTDAGGTVERCC